MTNIDENWSRPEEIGDLFLAFPYNVSHLMPERDFCERALSAMPDRGKRWLDLQSRWFFRKLPENVAFYGRDGINPERAYRHLDAIQRSFQPKHQHKEVAVAYLASLWFERVDYD